MNGSWKTIFSKSARRNTKTGQITAYQGTTTINTNVAYSSFRVLFQSSDNERYVYVSLKIN